MQLLHCGPSTTLLIIYRKKEVQQPWFSFRTSPGGMIMFTVFTATIWHQFSFTLYGGKQGQFKFLIPVLFFVFFCKSYREKDKQHALSAPAPLSWTHDPRVGQKWPEACIWQWSCSHADWRSQETGTRERTDLSSSCSIRVLLMLSIHALDIPAQPFSINLWETFASSGPATFHPNDMFTWSREHFSI